MKYRKKPVVIDAVQWTGTNHREMLDFLTDYQCTDQYMSAEGNYNGDRKHGSGAKTQRKVEPLIPFGTLGDDGGSDTLPFMR